MRALRSPYFIGESRLNAKEGGPRSSVANGERRPQTPWDVVGAEATYAVHRCPSQ